MMDLTSVNSSTDMEDEQDNDNDNDNVIARGKTQIAKTSLLIEKKLNDGCDKQKMILTQLGANSKARIMPKHVSIASRLLRKL
jgi:hypothetical protein